MTLTRARPLSLPMYGIAHADVEPFWHALAAALRERGLASLPPYLSWPAQLDAHWRNPDLLLSQTCGYPLVEELKERVQLVGVLHYRAPYCDGLNYRSIVIARADDPRAELAAFRGATVAYNTRNSHSGYNALRALVAPLSQAGRFFARAIASGSHYQSIELIRQRMADIASIDCVSLALLQRAHPGAMAGFKPIAQTASTPGLPLITSQRTSAEDLAILRDALAAVCLDPGAAPARARLLIDGFSCPPRSVYEVCKQMQDDAIALGYFAL